VVFQGFQDNMQVPLLAIGRLKAGSQRSFDWVPEVDVVWDRGGDEQKKNIDILCLSDGKLYVGEAKLNDRIEPEQFHFYEDLCQRVKIDGVVFATAKRKWGRGTRQRIERLGESWSGEVVVLTASELYQ
jgi:hypothetical protein